MAFFKIFSAVLDICSSMLQIPEEEKNLGPNDRLIHVYHFTKETAQNQMVTSLP